MLIVVPAKSPKGAPLSLRTSGDFYFGHETWAIIMAANYTLSVRYVSCAFNFQFPAERQLHVHEQRYVFYPHQLLVSEKLELITLLFIRSARPELAPEFRS